jgi:hypothetical protein
MFRCLLACEEMINCVCTKYMHGTVWARTYLHVCWAVASTSAAAVWIVFFVGGRNNAPSLQSPAYTCM